ncbi:hypothetical protein GW17_00043855 [Ensete ventricosum]|nr:hypothetical protein GW17_00043855 [Ensete ventricosum]
MVISKIDSRSSAKANAPEVGNPTCPLVDRSCVVPRMTHLLSEIMFGISPLSPEDGGSPCIRISLSSSSQLLSPQTLDPQPVTPGTFLGTMGFSHDSLLSDGALGHFVDPSFGYFLRRVSPPSRGCISGT